MAGLTFHSQVSQPSRHYQHTHQHQTTQLLLPNKVFTNHQSMTKHSNWIKALFRRHFHSKQSPQQMTATQRDDMPLPDYYHPFGSYVYPSTSTIYHKALPKTSKMPGPEIYHPTKDLRYRPQTTSLGYGPAKQWTI